MKGLALRRELNSTAPGYVVVGKGPNIEARARLFLKSGVAVPTYIKMGTNAWTLAGSYRAIAYLTDHASIETYRGDRLADGVAGILKLEGTDSSTVHVGVDCGYANPETRRAVELAAVHFVQVSFEAQGYTVEDVQSLNLGYDLLAINALSTLKLEVKGTDASTPRFFLTRNERQCAGFDEGWRLVMVTSARTAPKQQVMTIQEVERIFDLDPLAWECTQRA